MPRETFDHEYPPAGWTTEGISEALRESPPKSPLPTYDDTDAFAELATEDLTAPVVEEIIGRAADAKGEPVPSLPASSYLEYHRTGTRGNYGDVLNTRRSRLSALALAECFEREGAYLDDVLDYAWAVCEQATWLLPAHLGGEHSDGPQNHAGLPGIVPDEERNVALRSVRTARQLAELDHVLGDRLHPALRERIREEVDRRVFTPYEAREDFWWFDPPTNNWNAVCNASVSVAALYLLEDPDRQAAIVAKAARSLEGYLGDFGPDGGTAEGIGYWNFGFGNYVTLAAHLRARTGGAYSLLSPPIVEEIARYPLWIEMSPGRFVPFSDGSEDGRVDPFIACWLGRQLDLPELAARGRREFEDDPSVDGLGESLHTLQAVRAVPEDLTVPTPSRRVHLAGYDWWLSRVDPADPEGLVVVAKGGHNDESHNHNDLGSFVVHHRGESHLTDLGSPSYDAGYFSERRYEYLVARSLGHSVPHVNGTEQAAGEEYAATVTGRTEGEDTDTFGLDLSGAYPDAAGLSSLSRVFTLDRARERVRIEDEAAFESRDNEFVEVLVSYEPMETREGGLAVTGERGVASIAVDPEPDHTGVERLEEAVHGRDVWRARLSYSPNVEIGVSFDVDPG
ncbi:MAG: heparinase II/III family protein [Halobacteriales archaeon]